MDNVIALFPNLLPVPAILPTILTDEVVAHLQLCNSASRTLRSLGYKVIDEDPVPDDNGTPIIRIEPNHVRTALLSRSSDSHLYNRNTGVHSVKFAGCRVMWIERTHG